MVVVAAAAGAVVVVVVVVAVVVIAAVAAISEDCLRSPGLLQQTLPATHAHSSSGFTNRNDLSLRNISRLLKPV